MEAGKQVSRCNAVRHGLTAQTVISKLEDQEDYKAFEAAVVADYDAQSTIERELVLRLVSILWRLRRAISVETRLFEIQAEHLSESGNSRQPGSSDIIYNLFRTHDSACRHPGLEPMPKKEVKADVSAVEFARCFLRLANLPNFAPDRLSRYEATLWRQGGRILYALETLDRRKPEERRRGLDSSRVDQHGDAELSR
jgi:hypothetical protein